MVPRTAAAQISVGGESPVDAPLFGTTRDAASISSIASDGSGFMVGFTAGTPAHAMLAYVDRNGTVASGPRVVVDERRESSHPAIAFDGTNFATVWQVGDPALQGLAFARVTPSGTLLDAPAVDVLTGAPPVATVPCTAIASNPSVSLLAWTQNSNVFVQAIGPDAVLHGTPRLVASSSLCPAIASGNGEFLLAFASGSTPSTVVGLRIDASGAPLDLSPFPIASPPGELGSVSVAPGDADFLVAWGSFGYLTAPASVGAVRVDPAGHVVDASPIETTMVGDLLPVSVAQRADGWLAVWDYSAGNNAPYGDFFASIAPTGAFLDAIPHALPDAAAWRSASPVAWNGTVDLIGSMSPDIGTPVVRRVSAARELLDASPIQVGTDGNTEYDLALARSHDGALAVWSDSRRAPSASLVYVVLDADGRPIESAAHFLADTSSVPSVASDGDGYLITWSNNYQDGTALSALVGVRLAHDGSPLDAAPMTLSTVHNLFGHGVLTGFLATQLVFDGTAYVAVSQVSAQRDSMSLDVARVLPNGVVSAGALPPIDSRTSPPPIVGRYVASNGTNTLIAFATVVEPAGTRGGVGFVREDNHGALLDASPVRLRDTPAPTSIFVATDGVDYLALWTTASMGSFVARIASDGTVVDPGTAVTLPTSAAPAALTGMANGYVLAWIIQRTASDYTVMGTRLARDGSMLDPQGILLVDGIAVRATNETPVLATEPNAPTVLLGYERFQGSAAARRAMVREIVVTTPMAPDGGVRSDAALDAGRVLHAGGGCGCRTGSDSGARSPWKSLALLCAMGFVRRRRR